jgi:hypothetical protein
LLHTASYPARWPKCSNCLARRSNSTAAPAPTFYSHEAFELPGLWFTPSELNALLAAQKLLEDAQSGLLDSELAPLKRRIEKPSPENG